MRKLLLLKLNPYTFAKSFSSGFFCFYCHKAVAIACSVKKKKLLTPINKGEVCQLRLPLKKDEETCKE
jgi:hypothetical protein